MSNNTVDTVVIGAGVVGLAIARELAQRKKDVIVIEKETTFGSITSTRNSGVIHAGIYYDAGSMKAKLCAKGNRALYDYCNKKNVPHINVGKFVVATSEDEAKKLDSIYNKAEENEVVGISRVTKDYVNKKEPLPAKHFSDNTTHKRANDGCHRNCRAPYRKSHCAFFITK